MLVTVDGLGPDVQQPAAFHYVCMEHAAAQDGAHAIQDGKGHYVTFRAAIHDV